MFSIVRQPLLCRLSQTQRRLLQATYHLTSFTNPTFPSTSTNAPLNPKAVFLPIRTMSSSEAPRPTGLIASSGIELLTWSTPNGYKISILLEELAAAYGLKYTAQGVNIMQNIQKESWFTKYCPNGRIPVIIDHDRNDFAVFEGLAILAYLARHYDTNHQFSFQDPDFQSEAEQWMAFQHGSIGPIQGQANHFFRLAKERIPYPTQRYVGETERVYGVLDTRLGGQRDYLVGPDRGTYSIADIANWSWVNISFFSGVDLRKFEHLYKWWERINQRPAVQKGCQVPQASKFGNAAFLENYEKDPEVKAKEDGLRELRDKAMAQYGYKFQSP